MQLNPASSEARFQLAAVLRSLGQEQKARKELEDFQEKKQQSVKENVAGTKVNQANEYFQAGEYQRAVDIIAKRWHRTLGMRAHTTIWPWPLIVWEKLRRSARL